jgi:hypothetical protein
VLHWLVELPVVLKGLVLNRLILIRVIQSLRLLRPILLLLSRILQLSGGELLQWRRVLVLGCLLKLGRLLRRQLEVLLLLLLLLLWWQGELLLMVVILLSVLLPLGMMVLLVLL